MFGFLRNIFGGSRNPVPVRRTGNVRYVDESDPVEAGFGDGGTVDSFVEATGGGWGDPPFTIASDGGSQSDYVERKLEEFRNYAFTQSLRVGESFERTLDDIPVGIHSPHEISFGILMQAGRFGLHVDQMVDETIAFTVTKDPEE